MKNITIIFALAFLFFINTFPVFAQEPARGRETILVAPPAPSGRTETTVVLPDDTPVVTLPTPSRTPKVVVPSPSEITCTKSVSGKCTIFSCTDGTNTNTCDLVCKASSTKTTNTQEVAKQSENIIVIEDLTKIIKVTPSAAWAGYAGRINVEIHPGSDFNGYDSVIIGNNEKIAILSDGDKNNADPKATIKAYFYTPNSLFNGPKKLLFMNSKNPKSATIWSEKFKVIPATDAPSIVSVTPTSGKVGDIVQVKIVQGKKDYNTGGWITIGGMAAQKASSTYALRKENGGEYTLSVILNSNNKSGNLQLEDLSQQFTPVVADTYFTVEKVGIVTTFFNYVGGFFK